MFLLQSDLKTRGGNFGPTVCDIATKELDEEILHHDILRDRFRNLMVQDPFIEFVSHYVKKSAVSHCSHQDGDGFGVAAVDGSLPC